MALTPTQQRNAVSEGAALGLAMCETYAVTSETWRLSMAFEGAWRDWDAQWKTQFRQVDTDLRNGLNGYIALTRADERKQVFCLYWDRSGPEYVIYARESFAEDNFDADEVARYVSGDVPAEAWKGLAEDLLSRLNR